jgi:hypothetical protein
VAWPRSLLARFRALDAIEVQASANVLGRFVQAMGEGCFLCHVRCPTCVATQSVQLTEVIIHNAEKLAQLDHRRCLIDVMQ